MLNIVLLIIVIIILTLIIFKTERFQQLIPLTDLISYEQVVCRGAKGDKGPKGDPGIVL